MQFFDHYAFDATNVRKTADGYVVATPRVARTGIQLYAGREVGRPDLAVVRVYRSEDEVFSKDSLATYAFKPITDDHPRVPVTSKNWRDHAVGLVGDEIARDGEFIRVPMTMMDAGVIAKVEAGKAELSVGYTCDLAWEGGKTADGVEYDAVQKNIRVNHVAVVKEARGGRKLRIGDDKSPLLLSDGDALKVAPLLDWYAADATADAPTTDKKEKVMSDKTTKMITVDGVACTMDEQTAQIVQRALDGKEAEAKALRDQVAQLTADAAKAKDDFLKQQEEEKKKQEAKDAQIAALEQKLKDAEITPDRLNALVKDRAEVVGKAVAVLGDKAPKDLETQDTAAIQKLVVSAKLGDVAKDWSADQIKAAFTTLTSDVKPATPGVLTPAVTDAARALAHTQPGGGQTTKDAAQAAYEKRLQDAYKNPFGAATRQ